MTPRGGRSTFPMTGGSRAPSATICRATPASCPGRASAGTASISTVPAGDQGKRIFIDFDGAMANAKVWLNGQYVGTWPYGYQPFRLELTPHVKFGSENVLAVRLDTAHWGSRWYPGAGLYRNVWLVKTTPVHVAHWGVYVTTPSITDEEGKVRVTATLENQGQVRARGLGADGHSSAPARWLARRRGRELAHGSRPRFRPAVWTLSCSMRR